MKNVLLGVIAAFTLTACADDYYDYGYGYGDYRYGDSRAYYDNYYGPFYNGYWGGDGFFYYSPSRGRPFIRDEGRHFRHDRAQGFHGVRGHGVPRGEHRGQDGWHRDHDRDHRPG